MNALQLSDAEIVELAKGMCATLMENKMYSNWFDYLTWSDGIMLRPQRRLLRTTLRDAGFLSMCVSKFASRHPGSSMRYLMRVLHVYGEQVEDRLDLFRTPGFMEALEFELSHHESKSYFDCIQIMWGLLEEKTLAAKYAPMAKHFLEAASPHVYDASHAMGCIALMAKADGAAVLASDPGVRLVCLQSMAPEIDPMTSFLAANALAGLYVGNPSDEKLLDAVREFVNRGDNLIVQLQERERASDYRWISLAWMTDLIHSNNADFVLLATIGFSHLLQNSFNLPLLSPDDWDAIVLLQHHPDERIRNVWKKFICPFFAKMPYSPPKLQTILQMRYQLWGGNK